MSYDLTVYAPNSLSGARLRTVVESVAGLAVGEQHDTETTIQRGKRAAYSFTVFGPNPIEPEDLPDDVVPYVLDPTTSWQIVIEGSSQTEIGPARRFAKALAESTGGVAVDEQTDDILGKKKSRGTIAKPAAGEPVRELHLEWYSPAGGPNAAALWLQLAKKILPEALPRRFGSHEPLPYRLNRDGEDRFIACYGNAAWFSADLPCLSGGLHANRYGGLQSDSLYLLAAALEEPEWRNTVRRFFVEYARRRGSLLAVGEVLRNRSRGGPPHPLADVSGGTLRGYDGILGLPAIPVWWTWLGNDYLQLVGDFLPAEHTTYYPEGALYAPTEDPADRGWLQTLPDPIPADYRVVAIPSDYGPPNPPTNTPARQRPTIPVQVQRDEDGVELRARADAITRRHHAVLVTADDIDESLARMSAQLDRLAGTWTGRAAAGFHDGWARTGPKISADCAVLTTDLRRVGDRLAVYAVAYRDAAGVTSDTSTGRPDGPAMSGTGHLVDRTDLDRAVDLMRRFAVSINEQLETLLRDVDTLRQWDSGLTDIFRQLLGLTYRAGDVAEAVADQEHALRTAYHDRYPDTWLDYRRRMTRELAAAGIAEETVWEMVNSRFDYPQAVPIMVGWLQHFDERVPPGEPRRAMRQGLIRNLITKHARGNRAAVDVLFHQFDIEPPLSEDALQTTIFALAPLLQRQDFPRVAALLRRRSVGVMINDPQWWPPCELVQWLGRVKNEPAATELAVEQLANPRNRIAAMRALAQQRAPKVRALIARHLDDENEATRNEAAKALEKLPAE